MRKAHRHSSLFLLPLLAALLCCGSARAQFDEETSMDTVRVESNGVESFDTVLTAGVNVRSVPDSALRRLRASDAYWYANTAPPRKKQPERPQSQSRNVRISSGVGTFIWILIIAIFIGLVVWYLASSEIRIFRKASAPIDMGGSDEDTVEDIYTLDYGKAIARAVAAGDYRLAIRLQYLSTLKDLSNRGLINYTQERTNSEYLQQMAKTPHYRSFFRITRDFEYSWYGGFRITEETYARVQNEFADFKQQLRS